MINQYLKDASKRMDKTIKVLKDDLAGIRAGRANPKLLERILVDYYGAMTPINQLANISVPEPRLLVISPWDANLLPEIEKAIQKSDIGINPTNDGKVVRLVFPELTEERRRELVKMIKKMGEEAKIAIRAIRRDTNDKFRQMEKDSELTEDELKTAEKKVQELTDEYTTKIDEIIQEKEKEIMEL
ncbi:MAG TPA: ribosome recycling factor [Clostridiales bacterium]|nr:ribosome recycling factor [Clostridiales bacterium]